MEEFMQMVRLSQLAVAWPSLPVPFPVMSVIKVMGKQLGVGASWRVTAIDDVCRDCPAKELLCKQHKLQNRDCALSFDAAYIFCTLSHHSLEDSSLLQRMFIRGSRLLAGHGSHLQLCLDLLFIFVLCIGVWEWWSHFFLMQNPSSD